MGVVDIYWQRWRLREGFHRKEEAFREIEGTFTEHVHSMIPVEEGGDSSTFLVNEDRIIKVAKDRMTAQRLANETDFLSSAVHTLVPRLLTANVERLSEGSWSCQLFVKGLSGERCRPPEEAWDEIAAQLGELLSYVHCTNVLNGNLPFEPLPGAEKQLSRLAQYRSILYDHPQFSEAWRPFLEGNINIPVKSPLTPVVVHGDIKGEHLLLNQTRTKLLALIDWADICLSDPARDFSGLAIWLGRSFVEKVLLHYRQPVDSGLVDRALFYARSQSLIHLGERLEGESDAPLHLLETQLGWAFAEEA
ncbi:aminoglycoside phosphotransferase family protein [Bacillaceae bacterium SIJ1]|uniref:phosphotransferase family protein n=1 Tax=Litoribacterium kuwaitense TaxID=1398745 RepID=UPI0013EE3AA8|nr:aminoglycoside phosphotransferase family protein [Litoribacterium kuwaitense]NGP44866.1 aminoglycoside phosphotransferase family protein [Litoribacterium kuwaitense]